MYCINKGIIYLFRLNPFKLYILLYIILYYIKCVNIDDINGFWFF